MLGRQNHMAYFYFADYIHNEQYLNIQTVKMHVWQGRDETEEERVEQGQWLAGL